MKNKKLCTGLSLTHKEDGIWLNFESETGLYASIHLANTFKGKLIINTAILNWADERLNEEGIDNLCIKCVYPCFEQCPATYSDVEYDGINGILTQCDKYEFAKLNEPRINSGHPMDKPIEDFKQIAYNLRREGQVSRADAVMYLIERVKIAEGRNLSGSLKVKIISGDDMFTGIVTDIAWDVDHFIYKVNGKWFCGSEIKGE